MEQICQRCITNAYIRHLSIDRVQLANCSMLMTSECAGLRIIRPEKSRVDHHPMDGVQYVSCVDKTNLGGQR
jgi:hypothetical protein